MNEFILFILYLTKVPLRYNISFARESWSRQGAIKHKHKQGQTQKNDIIHLKLNSVRLGSKAEFSLMIINTLPCTYTVDNSLFFIWIPIIFHKVVASLLGVNTESDSN